MRLLLDGNAGRGRADRQRDRAKLCQLPAVHGELADLPDAALVDIQVLAADAQARVDRADPDSLLT
jgi:hypothetical protein